MAIDAFYDEWAPLYRYVYSDWEASVRRQADQLHSLIQECWGRKVSTILDAACGIGTQSLGLAALGYQVTGSTLSAAEVDEAQREANHRGLQVPFSVVDMRQVAHVHSDPFDVVIACDNAVPHLLNDEDILVLNLSSQAHFLTDSRSIDPGSVFRSSIHEPQTQATQRVSSVRETGASPFAPWQFSPDFSSSSARHEKPCCSSLRAGKHSHSPPETALTLPLASIR